MIDLDKSTGEIVTFPWTDSFCFEGVISITMTVFYYQGIYISTDQKLIDNQQCIKMIP